MGKKRSKSQRIGTEGEDQFRLFASRHHLIANKCEQDFGTDFICMIEGAQNKAGMSTVLGGVIGAFVRATQLKRGRIQLDKDDVEHLLACEYPVCVVLVHLRGNGEPSMHFSFVDGAFGEALAGFVESGGKHTYLTSSGLCAESLFDYELQRAIRPGFVEQFRVRLAGLRLDRVIPHSRIQVLRFDDGSFTLVKIQDFFSQFADDGISQPALHKAIFGVEHFMHERLSNLPLRPELIESLQGLPSPVVIEAAIPVMDGAIEVESGDGAVTNCAFEVRKSSDHTGWVHRSGFAITISTSTPHEGKWVHFLCSRADPDVPVILADYADLWDFLESCEPGAKLRFGEGGHAYGVELFSGLMKYGFFAKYLRRVSNLRSWSHGTWYLGDAMDEETLNTLAFLFYLDKAPEHINGMGFTFSDLESSEAPVKMWVPICMNLPRAGSVVWLFTEGKMLTIESGTVGFKFGKILDRDIELRDKRFTKSSFPEIVVETGIKTIPLVPPSENLNQYASDASTWGIPGLCEADSDMN